MSVSVCTALLAASAAVSGALAANQKTIASQQTNIAYAALVDGRNATAIKTYTLAINSHQLSAEKLARAHLNRALANQNVKQYQAAINDYSSALKLDVLTPKIRAVALYNRGLAHKNLKHPAMAIEDLTAALLLNPQFARAYYSRANILRDNGQYLFALADYKKARRFNHPDKHLTYFGEALTYDALRQSTRAKALLLKTVAIKPGFSPAREKLAAMGQAVPLPKLAAVQKRPAIQIAPVDPRLIPKDLITASITPGQADQTIRASNPLPRPVPVPANLKAKYQTPTLPKHVVAERQMPKRAIKSHALKPSDKSTAPRATKVVKTAKLVSKVVQLPQSNKSSSDARPAAKLSGWTVQLTSQRNSTAAWDVWKNLSARYARLLKGQQATVIKADLGDRGIYYRLRVHKLNSRKKAARLCNQLKRKGTSCFVSKA